MSLDYPTQKYRQGRCDRCHVRYVWLRKAGSLTGSYCPVHRDQHLQQTTHLLRWPVVEREPARLVGGNLIPQPKGERMKQPKSDPIAFRALNHTVEFNPVLEPETGAAILAALKLQPDPDNQIYAAGYAYAAGYPD